MLCSSPSVVVALNDTTFKMTKLFPFFFTYRLLPEVSRSLIDSALVPSLFVRSGVTRSRLSSLSESSHSKDLSVKLLRTSRSVFISHYHCLMTRIPDPIHAFRPISVSSPPPWWLFRKPPRPTLSLSLKIPTWLLSTRNVSFFHALHCLQSFTLFFRCYYVSHPFPLIPLYLDTNIVPTVNPRI